MHVPSTGAAVSYVKGKKPHLVDIIYAIDPGEKNIGMAVFVRGSDGNLCLERAVQIDLSGNDVSLQGTGAYVLACILNHTDQMNAAYRRNVHFSTMAYFYNIGVVFEQQPPRAIPQRQLIMGIQSVAHWVMPKMPVKMHFATLAPETYRVYLGIPRTKTHAERKRATKARIELLIGESLPRHDSTDAIAVGLAAVDRKFTLRQSETWKPDTHQSWYDALFAQVPNEPQPQTSDDPLTPVDQKEEPIIDEYDCGPPAVKLIQVEDEADGTIFGGGGCSGDY